MTGDQMAKITASLIRNGADPNARVQACSNAADDEIYLTALHLLCMQRNELLVVPMLRTLLNLGANPRLSDRKGRDVMAYAVAKKRLAIVDVLVSTVLHMLES